MKIVDANVLLYATNRSSRQHQASHQWLTHALSSSETIGFPWVSLLAYVRLSTNPRIFGSPLSAETAFDQVDSWLRQPPSIIVAPTTRHASILRGLLLESGTAANLTTDAHLAAMAIEHGADIVTFDRDFARFSVRVHRPGRPAKSGPDS